MIVHDHLLCLQLVMCNYITDTAMGPELTPKGHHTSMHVVKNDYSQL